MATAIYMRVSTQHQEEFGASLHTQKERLQAYCVHKGLSNIKEYLDVGSGRTTDKRINFMRMMEDIKNGYITNVVILKLDRLTRSIIDLNKLVNELNEHNCELHSSTENIDTTTASGRMMLNLIGTFAQWESETISERVSVNMHSLAERGQWQSKTPYGYTLVNQRLEINEDEQATLQEAFQLVLEGSSFTNAEREIEKKYNIDWGRDFLINKVRNPSTVGDITRNGEIIKKDAFPPLVSRETQRKLISALDERGVPRSKYKGDDLFRRKIICPKCGEIMSLRSRTSKVDNRMMYSYGCHHCHRSKRPTINVNENVLERALIKRLNDGFLNINFKDGDVTPNNNEREIKKLKRSLESLERQKKRIQRAWLEDRIEDVELEQHQLEIDEQVLNAENRLKELNISTMAITNDKIAGFQTTLQKLYPSMTKEEKVKFIQLNIKEIHFTRELIEGYKMKYIVTVTDIVFF